MTPNKFVIYLTWLSIFALTWLKIFDLVKNHNMVIAAYIFFFLVALFAGSVESGGNKTEAKSTTVNVITKGEK
jgi:hypothetical protein